MMYRCPFCGRLYATLFTLKGHVKKMHGGATCPLCGKKVKCLFRHAVLKYSATGRKEYAALAYLFSGEHCSRKKHYREIAEELFAVVEEEV